MSDLVTRKHDLLEPGWRASYGHLPALVNRLGLKRGADVGVAFGGHCEAILDGSGVELLNLGLRLARSQPASGKGTVPAVSMVR